MPLSIVLTLTGLAVTLALITAVRRGISQSREGRILAFAALVILPAITIWAGFEEHLDRATSTSFCLSCHVMEDYGKSLHYDDKSYLAAAHFQNHLVPPDHACYTCHTDYAMFGGVKAKFRGLRHIYVQYLGTVPRPADIKLYSPFPNETCLHCHLGARKFEEVAGHHRKPETMSDMKSGKTSCLAAGCHDTVHEVGDLPGSKMWFGAKQ